MPLFRYKALGSDGQVLYGEIEAPSRAAAVSRLQHSGHLPISAEEVDSRRHILHRLSARFRQPRRVTHRDIVILTRELATLLQAGLPLDTALQTLAELSDAAQVKDLIRSIHDRVRQGASLSDAMSEQGGTFSRLYLNMLRAGEAGGSMHIIIERIADYLENMAELRSTVITALIYPAILVVICILSLFVLMGFVVPKFIPLFEGVDATLPLLTQMVFSVSTLFRDYWWVALCLVAAAAWLGDRYLATPANRRRVDAWLLDLPQLGELIQQMEVARFSRTLGTLLNNGVPVLTAITLVREVISNTAMGGVMDDVVTSLEQGQRLARPLKASPWYPSLAVQLIEVGEESGELDRMLFRIADIYDREVQARIRRLLTLLEPVLILGLGGVIAVIIISILLAMLGLNELVI